MPAATPNTPWCAWFHAFCSLAGKGPGERDWALAGLGGEWRALHRVQQGEVCMAAVYPLNQVAKVPSRAQLYCRLAAVAVVAV